MPLNVSKILTTNRVDPAEAEQLLGEIGFADCPAAQRRLATLVDSDESRQALSRCLPMLLNALSTAATPDGSLINFERYVQSVSHRADLFRYLASNPRAVEILIKLFVGSQFLTEILLRNPDYLGQLTQHKRLAEFKSRQDLVREANELRRGATDPRQQFDVLRRYQRWELLRIGACDAFGLMDLKSVTIQLSLLADSVVQCCLNWNAEDLKVDLSEFCVLAFGKLGGEELNYSSDIDLVFVAQTEASRYWTLGQRLIKTLIESTGEGFFYRVDMRLRPWGRSGPLVTSNDAYLDYLRTSGMLWEKQALIKARPIAGNLDVGTDFLKRAEPLIFGNPAEAVRENVRQMKKRIEANLQKQGREWGEVKSGAGSIRDIEFITQYLQLAHGGENRHVRSINTLDGLIRLADFGYLKADEYRQLTSGYVFLRTIEHSLQLMHYKQTNTLPESSRELSFLARRLDFQTAEQFLAHYQQHCTAIRAIYQRYIAGKGSDEASASPRAPQQMSDHLARMEPSYTKVFSTGEIARHVAMWEKLSDERLVVVQAEETGDRLWKVTIVGYDFPGDLSLMSGLLFVFGFNIIDGNVFTDLSSSRSQALRGSRAVKGRRKFVNSFTVSPPLETVLPEVWERYETDLEQLMRLTSERRLTEAQGQLAKRVAGALREISEPASTLLPVEIELDNNTSEESTVLHIRAEDTIGFLYEFANALALARYDVRRMIIRSVDHFLFDTLYITDEAGNKITNEQRQQELRAAVVLIKHFTHLLPTSPNPEAALLHFRDFLENLFQQPNWLQELASLEQSRVLHALAKLLGVSDFLWEDFLRLQHNNLFPVVRDIDALAHSKPREELEAELDQELSEVPEFAAKRDRLNAFKDREMFRADMRHILEQDAGFGSFSRELTLVAEVVVSRATRICQEELAIRYGRPLLEDGTPCPLSVCALGKCGGRELGFASDIELMFLYQGPGKTNGSEVIGNPEYFQKLAELFTHTIVARSEGIFQIDLRLRPYGQAGSLAVSVDAFVQYFAPHGAAWPYERQALVKLRPIAGDAEFGERIVQIRDELIYTGEPFDAAAMRAMRERQLRQLVQAGTINAKLGPGGLVDCEYLVQGLQITYGQNNPALRTTNTRKAMRALCDAGILTGDVYQRLHDDYVFQRRLIDALRMVRGNARDLTVPDASSEEFVFLARRMGYGHDVAQLSRDIEAKNQEVVEFSRLLDRIQE